MRLWCLFLECFGLNFVIVELCDGDDNIVILILVLLFVIIFGFDRFRVLIGIGFWFIVWGIFYW